MSIFTNVKNGVVEGAKKVGAWASERKDTLAKVGLGVGGGLLTLGVGAKILSDTMNNEDEWIDIEFSEVDVENGDCECNDNEVENVEVEVEEVSIEEK